MALQGNWRIVEMPDDEADFPDMMGPAYIAVGPKGGEFSFGCVTGAFAGSGDHDAVQFDWDGNDEMDEACGLGWAELQPDGSLAGEICVHGDDEITFTTSPRATSSTACKGMDHLMGRTPW